MKSARLLSAITSATDAFIDDATTVTVETSARPIISAVAVFAVRRGLRSAFRRASAAVVPPSRASGAPRTRVTAVAISGARVSTPARVSSIAMPASSRRPSPAIAATSPAAPSSVRTAPTPIRTRPTGLAGASIARIAATGATLVACRAGSRAASIVTTTPTSSAATMVRGSTCSVVVGTSIPKAASAARRPAATPMPRPRPRPAATSPMTNDSAITENRTWRREAPTARSSASSRVRWATRIENVFQMISAPTSSEIAAKPSRPVVKKLSPSATAALDSATTSADVTASSPPGRTAAMRSRSSSGEVPGSPATAISSNTPALPSTCCAVARSKVAMVAPARLSASPNPAIPDTVNCRGPSASRIVTGSPGAKPCFAAVAASSTTSPGPDGASPERRVNPPARSRSVG